ncbi:hypothetical protein [Exiguobacterium sp. s138]|uniref:hypothetical protein n=1 Tax=Exiguobacterium sp. s138 TaxID=2751202 RepID=UPI001BE8DDF2|nr:hypothetical protein [Exiguobacterium sp. s138]
MFDKFCICDFFNGASVYSVQYLGWATAIVVAMLALTSIVFSQFNERSIQKSNDIARSIRNYLNKEFDKSEENIIKEDYDHMIYLLSNTSIYDKTMKLFTYLSYFIVFLWWFSLVGYLNDAKTLIDKIIIIGSTILISLPFIYLPEILKGFNKNQPIKLNEKGYIELKDFIDFFKKNTNLVDSDIILRFLSPRINIKFDTILEINYSMSSKISNLTCIVILNNGDKRLIINLNQDLFESKRVFHIHSFENNLKNQSDLGLFNLLREMNKSEVQIYISNSLRNFNCFSGKININRNKIEIYPIKKIERTLDKQIFELKNTIEVTPQLGKGEKFKIN